MSPSSWRLEDKLLQMIYAGKTKERFFEQIALQQFVSLKTVDRTIIRSLNTGDVENIAVSVAQLEVPHLSIIYLFYQ